MLDRLFWKGLLVIAALILCCGLICRAVRAQEAEEHGPPHHSEDSCWLTTDADARCRCECRKQHCKDWIRCNELENNKERSQCQDLVSKTWNECQGSCANG